MKQSIYFCILFILISGCSTSNSTRNRTADMGTAKQGEEGKTVSADVKIDCTEPPPSFTESVRNTFEAVFKLSEATNGSLKDEFEKKFESIPKGALEGYDLKSILFYICQISSNRGFSEKTTSYLMELAIKNAAYILNSENTSKKTTSSKADSSSGIGENIIALQKLARVTLYDAYNIVSMMLSDDNPKLIDEVHEVKQLIKFIAVNGESISFRNVSGHSIAGSIDLQGNKLFLGQYGEDRLNSTSVIDNDTKKPIKLHTEEKDNKGRQVVSIPVSETFSITEVVTAKGDICPKQRNDDWILLRPERFRHLESLEFELFLAWKPTRFELFTYDDQKKVIIKSDVRWRVDKIAKSLSDYILPFREHIQTIPQFDKLNDPYTFSLKEPEKPYIVSFSCPI